MLNDLNEPQKEAALENGNCLVLAGPGSGKTKMLASKTANDLSKGIKIVAVTFTKDSAIEIRSRIMKITNGKFKENLLVGTFHGLCYMLLSPPKNPTFGKNILAGIKGINNFKMDIATEGDRQSYVQRALDLALIPDIDTEMAASLIEQAKALFTLDKPMDNNQKRLFVAYQEVMKRNHKLDFQDLISETVKGFRNGTILPFKTDKLFVDESQDIDMLQYEWIAQHTRRNVKTMLVGDDDQSIYGWRSAMGYIGMEKFGTEFNAKRVILNINYRCKEEILSSSSILVQKNQGRLLKNLIAHKGVGGKVELRQYVKNRVGTDDDRSVITKAECDELAIQLQQEIALNKSCAVIGRTNSVLDDVEESLVKFRVPYTRQAGGSILDKQEAAIFANIVELVCDKNKKSGVDNLLSWAGMTEDGLQSLHHAFGNVSLAGLSTKLANNIDISEHDKKIFNDFNKRLANWKENRARSEYLVIEGIKTWMIERAQTPYSLKIIEAFAAILDNIDDTLEKRIDVIKSKKDKKEEKDDDGNLINKVMLITAHSSKGLEWDTVWVVAVDDESFPDKKSGVEEERRLMYVAMTRARDKLIVSCSKRPSQFIDEADLYKYNVE